MKISSQDEYGLRIMIRIARQGGEKGLSIPQISEMEGISQAYTAKMTRLLRLSGLIASTRGQKGGYVLSKDPAEISVGKILKDLGGPMFSEEFCNNHSGQQKLCTNSVDCSVRSLWKIVQSSIDQLLDRITLADLCSREATADRQLQQILDRHIEEFK